jgi:hypothetical protein
LIGFPPTEAVPTNTEQITADIPVMARDTEKLVELRVEMPLLDVVLSNGV